MIFRTLLFTTILFAQQEFDFDGPYGINYFDTANQFIVQDLNAPVIGDVNSDEILNIQDVILLINIILDDSDFMVVADMNQDDMIDVIDVVLLVNIILEG